MKAIAANQANKAITQRAPALQVLLAQTVADNAITSAKIADDAVKAGELGPTQVVTSNGAGVANNTTGTVTVQCPAGTQMLSGGGNTTLGGNDLVLMLRSLAGWERLVRHLSEPVRSRPDDHGRRHLSVLRRRLR